MGTRCLRLRQVRLIVRFYFLLGAKNETFLMSRLLLPAEYKPLGLLGQVLELPPLCFFFFSLPCLSSCHPLVFIFVHHWLLFSALFFTLTHPWIRFFRFSSHVYNISHFYLTFVNIGYYSIGYYSALGFLFFSPLSNILPLVFHLFPPLAIIPPWACTRLVRVSAKNAKLQERCKKQRVSF